MSAAWEMFLRETADPEDLKELISYVSCHINFGNGTCKEIRFTSNSAHNVVTDYIKRRLAPSTAIALAQNLIRARVEHLKRIVNGWRNTSGRFGHTFALNVINEFLSDNAFIQDFELQNFGDLAWWSELKSSNGLTRADEEGKVISKTREELMGDNVYPEYDWLFSNKLYDLDPMTRSEEFYRARTQILLLGRHIPIPKEWAFDRYIAGVRAAQSHKKRIQEHKPSTKRLICSFMGKCTNTKYREFRVRYTTEMMNFEILDLEALTLDVRFRCRLRQDVSEYKYMWNAVGKGVTLNSAPYLHAMFEAGEEAVKEFEEENMHDDSTTWADELPLQNFLRFFSRTIHYETSHEAMKIKEDDPIATQSGIDFMEKFKMSGDNHSAFNDVVFDTVPLTEADLYPSPPTNGNQSSQTENGACSDPSKTEIKQNNVTVDAETQTIVDETVIAVTTVSSSLSSRIATPLLDDEATNGDVKNSEQVVAKELDSANLQSSIPTLSYAKAVKKSTGDVRTEKNPVQNAAIPLQVAVPAVLVAASEKDVHEVQEYQHTNSNRNKSRRGKNSKKNNKERGDSQQVVAKQNGGLSTNTPPMNGNNANGATSRTTEQTPKPSEVPEQSASQPPQQQVANREPNQDASYQPPSDSNNSSNDAGAVAANKNEMVPPPNQKKEKNDAESKKEETKAATSNLENEARTSTANQNGQASTSNRKQKKDVKSKASTQKKKVQNQIPDQVQAVQAQPLAQRKEMQAQAPADHGNGPQLNNGDLDVAQIAPEREPNEVVPHPEADNGVSEQSNDFVAQDQANPAVAIEPNVVDLVPEEEAVPVALELEAINIAPEQHIIADASEPRKKEEGQPGTSEKHLSKSQKRKARKAAIKALEKEKEAAIFDEASTEMLQKLIMSSDNKAFVEADIVVQVKSGKNNTPNKKSKKGSPETITVKAVFTDDFNTVVVNGVSLADQDAVQHPELPVSSSNSDNEEETSPGDGSTKICTFDYRPGVRSSQDDDAPEQEGTEMQLMNSKGCSAGNDYDDEYEAVPCDPAPGAGRKLANPDRSAPYVASDKTHHNKYQVLLHLSNNRRLLCSIDHTKQKLIHQRLLKFRNIYSFRRRIAKAMLYILQEDLAAEKGGLREEALVSQILLYMLVDFENNPNSSLAKQIDDITKNVSSNGESDSDSIHRGLRFLDRRLVELDPKSDRYLSYGRIRDKLLDLVKQLETVYAIARGDKFNEYEGRIY